MGSIKELQRELEKERLQNMVRAEKIASVNAGLFTPIVICEYSYFVDFSNMGSCLVSLSNILPPKIKRHKLVWIKEIMVSDHLWTDPTMTPARFAEVYRLKLEPFSGKDIAEMIYGESTRRGFRTVVIGHSKARKAKKAVEVLVEKFDEGGVSYHTFPSEVKGEDADLASLLLF